MNRADILNTIDTLMDAVNQRRQQLHSLPVNSAYQLAEGKALEELKALGRAAVFDLMLHSTHRQFLAFLKEYDHE